MQLHIKNLKAKRTQQTFQYLSIRYLDGTSLFLISRGVFLLMNSNYIYCSRNALNAILSHLIW